MKWIFQKDPISKPQQNFGFLFGVFLFSPTLAVTKKYGNVGSGDAGRGRAPKFFSPRKDTLVSKVEVMASSKLPLSLPDLGM